MLAPCTHPLCLGETPDRPHTLSKDFAPWRHVGDHRRDDLCLLVTVAFSVDIATAPGSKRTTNRDGCCFQGSLADSCANSRSSASYCRRTVHSPRTHSWCRPLELAASDISSVTRAPTTKVVMSFARTITGHSIRVNGRRTADSLAARCHYSSDACFASIPFSLSSSPQLPSSNAISSWLSTAPGPFRSKVERPGQLRARLHQPPSEQQHGR